MLILPHRWATGGGALTRYKMRKGIGNTYSDTYSSDHVKGLGHCEWSCKYCHKNKRFKKVAPHFLSKKAIHENLGSGRIVFVASGSDICAPNISDHDRRLVLDHCANYPGNTYWIQTKAPEVLTSKLEFLEHPVWACAYLGTTIETNRDYHLSLAPSVEQRADALATAAEYDIRTYVTLEPLVNFDIEALIDLVKRCQPSFVHIGRNTRRQVMLLEPARYQVIELIHRLAEFTTVKVKSNATIWKLR